MVRAITTSLVSALAIVACSSPRPPPTSDEVVGRDASTGGPPATDGGYDSTCAARCTCLEQTCLSDGYAYASQDECRTECATLSIDRKTCFLKWCQIAKGLAPGTPDRTHLCQHALGQLDLDECSSL